MLARQNSIVAGVVLLAAIASATILSPCEEADERVADKESCTRYHICREDPDSTGDFLSDIAICPMEKVFDMVTSTCVDVEVEKGYLQDPESCTSFYGCRLPSQSSEGYLRTKYICPGGNNGQDGLRFDPDLRQCTYKTNVPDSKCNSHVAVQAILGTQETETVDALSDGGSGGAATQSEPANSATAEDDDSSSNLSEDTGSESADASEDAPTEAPTEETEAPTDADSSASAGSDSSASAGADSDASDPETPANDGVESFDSASSTSDGSRFRVVTPGERPAKPLTDIDQIAQVIKGQLLTRRKASQASSKP